MGFLRNLINNDQAQPQEITYRFIQSANFRGYKRFHVSYYGYAPAEHGLADWTASGARLDGAEIVLQSAHRDEYEFIDVFVDGYFIGSVPFWDDDPQKRSFADTYFYSGRVDGAHIMVKGPAEKPTIALFMHPAE